MTRRIFIFGLGSIGQRYARLLREMYGEDLELLTVRRRKFQTVIGSDLKSATNLDPCKEFGIIEHSELSTKLGEIDLAIISSPIHMHASDLRIVGNLGIAKRILVEKPLFGTLSNDADNYWNTDSEINQSNIFVAFQSRYHPLFQKLRELVEMHGSTNILRYESWFSESLETMHPYEDYRISHMGKLEESGDPISCFSHDVDIFLQLMGEQSILSAHMSKISELEINSPDFQRVDSTSSTNEAHFNSLSFDFVGWPQRRGGRISLKNGVIEWDWINSEIKTHTKSQGLLTFNYGDLTRDKIFTMELQDLLENSKISTILAASFSEGIATTKFLDEARAIGELEKLEAI
jgi:predicted dehydrogenase